MKIVIVGAGNMGGAIIAGIVKSKTLKGIEVTAIDHRGHNVEKLQSLGSNLKIVVADYSSLVDADAILLALKPWLIEDFLFEYKNQIGQKAGQMLLSVAGGITLAQLAQWAPSNRPLFRIMPNTAIAVAESMTFISAANASESEVKQIEDVFAAMGKVSVIDEKLFSAATSLASCGIAYAFRYIRAAMEGGIEMGFYPSSAREAVLQTLKGAVAVLEANGTHPEVEIDKVTTAGGITIKGLNEMEHAGFSSSIIQGLKKSNV